MNSSELCCQNFYIPNQNFLVKIAGTKELTNQIKKQWVRNCPFIVAIYKEEDGTYNFCKEAELIKRHINPRVTQTFFYILQISKKGDVSNYYMGSYQQRDPNKDYFLDRSLKAIRGNTESILELGKAFLFGTNVAKNYKIAKKLLKISFEEHQNINACYYLGHLYKRSPKLKNCFKKMEEYFSIAAANGFIDAQYQLGLLYYDESMLENISSNNAEKAFLWCLRAAKNGSIDAQFLLSEFYEKGIGREIDLEKAYYCMIMAAVNKNYEAEKYLDSLKKEISNKTPLANAYYQVVLAFENNPKLSANTETKKLLMNQAAKLGHKKAQLKMGEYLYAIGFSNEAKEWFKKAKDQGDLVATFFYSQTEKVSYPEALFLLGRNLKKGKNIIKNEEQAIICLENASRSGIIEADYELGVLYCSSIDTKKHDLGLEYLKYYFNTIRDKKDGVNPEYLTEEEQKHYEKAASMISCQMPD